jgi:hypothetical protein
VRIVDGAARAISPNSAAGSHSGSAGWLEHSRHTECAGSFA